MSNFEIRQDSYGIGDVLILKGKWTADIRVHMLENSIAALRLTDSFGFNGHELSFLSELTFLRSLELYCWEAKNVNLIEGLPQLEVLGLQYKSQRKVDLSNFTKLRVALVTWSQGLSSLFKLKSLEILNVSNYPFENIEPISHMQSLRELYLTSRKLQSLEGISKLQKLETLDLYNCTYLSTLSGTEHCPQLDKIEVEACNRINT